MKFEQIHQLMNGSRVSVLSLIPGVASALGVGVVPRRADVVGEVDDGEGVE